MIRALLITLSFCLAVNATENDQAIHATCNDDGSLNCPSKLKPTCSGRKKATCLKMNKVYIPTCHADGGVSADEELTFTLDKVECLQGNRRLK